MAGVYDLAIIGGGINGCGIARDAAGRGYSTFLCERDDLASGTSSASTKLIHGGLRYLEYYEFRLVREALREREVLWRMAPHIVWPLRFVLPHSPDLRPAWLLRLGLFLYDHLGGRERLPGTRTLDLRTDAAGDPLKPVFSNGFEYSDCWVEDARLVVLNAQDAARMGATIRTRTRFVSAERGSDGWTLTVEDTRTGRRSTVQAGAVINAAGPWVAQVMGSGLPSGDAVRRIRLVQGSHIVVPRLYDHDRCYIFQNGDGRIVFAIPYETDFTLIGTTDQDYKGDPGAVHASETEISYLCAAASEYFRRPIARADVVWSYSGVRPLVDDGATAAQAATRDYVLALDAATGTPPLLSVYGGKITTYRKLSEAAFAKLGPHLPAAPAPGWTSRQPLPGGDFPVDGVEALVGRVRTRYPFLAPAHALRLVRAYGTRVPEVLGDAASMADLGRAFGATLTEAEVRWMMREEWAERAADIVWRRTKLGLRLTAEEIEALDAFMAAAGREGRSVPAPGAAAD